MRFKKCISLFLVIISFINIFAFSTSSVNAATPNKMPDLITSTKKQALSVSDVHRLVSQVKEDGYKIVASSNPKVLSSKTYYVVTSQSPKKGTILKKGQKITIKFENAIKFNAKYTGSANDIVENIKEDGFKKVSVSYRAVSSTCSNLKINSASVENGLYYPANTDIKLVLSKNNSATKYANLVSKYVRYKSYSAAVSVLKKQGFHNIDYYGPSNGKVTKVLTTGYSVLKDGKYDCCKKVILLMTGKTLVPNILKCENPAKVMDTLYKAGFVHIVGYGDKNKKPSVFMYNYKKKEYVNKHIFVDTDTVIYVGFGLNKKQLKAKILIDFADSIWNR